MVKKSPNYFLELNNKLAFKNNNNSESLNKEKMIQFHCKFCLASSNLYSQHYPRNKFTYLIKKIKYKDI